MEQWNRNCLSRCRQQWQPTVELYKITRNGAFGRVVRMRSGNPGQEQLMEELKQPWTCSACSGSGLCHRWAHLATKDVCISCRIILLGAKVYSSPEGAKAKASSRSHICLLACSAQSCPSLFAYVLMQLLDVKDLNHTPCSEMRCKIAPMQTRSGGAVRMDVTRAEVPVPLL